MQKISAALMATVLAAAALVGFVLAGEANAATADVAGRGVLYARGSGVAEVTGDGRVDIRSFGAGTVTISGAERIDARGDGHRVDLPDGSVKFTGWNGYVRAYGEDLTVRMAGGRIAFRAAGEGAVFLKGHGQFRVGDRTGRWTEEGATLELGS